jgi:hypothetical protein
VNGQFDALAALPPGKEPRYPSDRRLGEPQKRSGWREEETNLTGLKGALDSSVGVATRLRWVVSIGVRYTAVFRPVVGHSQSPIQWESQWFSEASYPWAKCYDHETYLQSSRSSEVNNALSCSPHPPLRLSWVVHISHTSLMCSPHSPYVFQRQSSFHIPLSFVILIPHTSLMVVPIPHTSLMCSHLIPHTSFMGVLIPHTSLMCSPHSPYVS